MEKMNKVKKLCMLLFITVVIITSCFSGCGKKKKDVPSLDEIAKDFNENPEFEDMKKNGSFDVEAKAEKNNLIVTVTIGENKNELKYELKNNKLSKQSNESDFFSDWVYFTYLIKTAHHVRGYDYDVISLAFDDIKKEDLEKYGIVVDEKKYYMSYDLTKTMNIPDSSELDIRYVSVDDLRIPDDMKEHGSYFYEKKVGDNYVHINDSKDETVILAAGKKGLTGATYKSLLSAIEVVFDDHNATDYFYSNCNDVKRTKFKGFVVELNPSKTDFEKQLLSDYEFMRVTIDMDVAKKAIKKDKYAKTDSIEVLYKNNIRGTYDEDIAKAGSNYENSKFNIVETIIGFGKLIAILAVIGVIIFLIVRFVKGSASTLYYGKSKVSVPVRRTAANEERLQRIMGEEAKEENVQEAELSKEDLIEYEREKLRNEAIRRDESVTTLETENDYLDGDDNEDAETYLASEDIVLEDNSDEFESTNFTNDRFGSNKTVVRDDTSTDNDSFII